MNQGKIWRVVKPTVGVPIFLGTVVLTSLFVHYQLLHNTEWLPKYYQGGMKAAPAAAMAPTSSLAADTTAPTVKQ